MHPSRRRPLARFALWMFPLAMACAEPEASESPPDSPEEERVGGFSQAPRAWFTTMGLSCEVPSPEEGLPADPCDGGAACDVVVFDVACEVLGFAPSQLCVTRTSDGRWSQCDSRLGAEGVPLNEDVLKERITGVATPLSEARGPAFAEVCRPEEPSLPPRASFNSGLMLERHGMMHHLACQNLDDTDVWGGAGKSTVLVEVDRSLPGCAEELEAAGRVPRRIPRLRNEVVVFSQLTLTVAGRGWWSEVAVPEL